MEEFTPKDPYQFEKTILGEVQEILNSQEFEEAPFEVIPGEKELGLYLNNREKAFHTWILRELREHEAMIHKLICGIQVGKLSPEAQKEGKFAADIKMNRIISTMVLLNCLVNDRIGWPREKGNYIIRKGYQIVFHPADLVVQPADQPEKDMLLKTNIIVG